MKIAILSGNGRPDNPQPPDHSDLTLCSPPAHARASPAASRLLVVFHDHHRLRTSRSLEFLDVTGFVADAVRQSGITDGVVQIQTLHTTAAVVVNEHEPLFRPIKYSLFPPLGLATLAGYLGDGDDVELQDEHVESLDLDDRPDLVVIQVYITSARRAYRIADHYRRRGVHVALGGLHPNSLPEEAARHADTVFVGPGEDTWPRFLADFRAGRAQPLYRSTVRTLNGLPSIRRDLIRRHLYLVPNSIVVSRGCPHACDFCYKEAFFEGGRGFYTQTVDAALAEIERLPGRHLYFLDDHLFGNARGGCTIWA